MATITGIRRVGATLGYGEDIRVLLMSKGGGSVLAELKPTTGDFSRLLNGTGTANLTGVSSSNADGHGCDGWDLVDPWATEILIERDGRDAFSGPVTDVSFAAKSITVVADDITAWWDRREQKDAKFKDADATTVIKFLHAQAMEDDPIAGFNLDCELTGHLVTKTYKLLDGKYTIDSITELVQSYVDYCAYGRTVIVGPQEIPATPYFTILDDWWVTPPIVHERGNDQATRVIVIGKGIMATATASQEYLDHFGIITRIFNEPNISDKGMLQRNAQSKLDHLKDAEWIETPQGAGLLATAPVTLPELIPGIRVRVNTSATCKNLVQDFRLTAVKADLKGLVSIDLAPIGTLVTVGGTVEDLSSGGTL